MASADYTTRLLTGEDWQQWKAIRLESLLDSPAAFGRSYEEDCDKDDAYFRDGIEVNAIWGAFVGDNLVGVVGFSIERGERYRHKGKIFGVYTVPAARGKGICKALLLLAIEYAKTKVMWLAIHVWTTNLAAYRLYESVGWQVYLYREGCKIIVLISYSSQVLTPMASLPATDLSKSGHSSDVSAHSPAPVPIRDSFVRDLVAGGMSGIIAKTIGAPADRVKLLIQTQSINTNLLVKYKNPIDCIVRVYKDQGLASFWRGNLANVYRYFPSQAMNFAFKDKYKDFFGKLFVGNPKAGTSGAGSLIG
eukprot:gene25201-28490_t